MHSHDPPLDPTGKLTPALIHSIAENATAIAVNALTTEGPEDPLFWVGSAGNMAALVNDAAILAVGHPIIPQFVVTGLEDAGALIGTTAAGADIYDAATGVLDGSVSLAELGNVVTKNLPGLIDAIPSLSSATKGALSSNLASTIKGVTGFLGTLKL